MFNSPPPLNPNNSDNPDFSSVEESLQLLSAATDEFQGKAEQVNNQDLDRQDDDNPEPTPLGEEAVRAAELQDKVEALQKKLLNAPPTSEEALSDLAEDVKELFRTAGDIGINVLPGAEL